MKYLFAAVYVLVLLTQLPHVGHAYASLETPGWHLATITAWGAAVAFELSTGVFTLRVVQGSKRRWTRIGLAFFIVASCVANAYYYAWWPQVFDSLMPVFATLALPASLALFAEEFGAELGEQEKARKKAIRDAAKVGPHPIAEPPKVAPAMPYWCEPCEEGFPTPQHYAAHVKHQHSNHRNTERIPAKEGA